MIVIQRPGQQPLEIDFILIDFEGTLAQDRRVHPRAKDKLNLLSKRARVYIFTKADREIIEDVLRRVKAEIFYLREAESSRAKVDLLRQLGARRTVAIGNGLDDVWMMEEAALGICVMGKEGASGEAMKKADVVVTDFLDALDFLLKPLRHQATLGR